MRKITDLSHYRNKKLLMNETKKLAYYILEQAKQGVAIHTVEQGIWDKLLNYAVSSSFPIIPKWPLSVLKHHL